MLLNRRSDLPSVSQQYVRDLQARECTDGHHGARQRYFAVVPGATGESGEIGESETITLSM